jgi:hypothetical protein
LTWIQSENLLVQLWIHGSKPQINGSRPSKKQKLHRQAAHVGTKQTVKWEERQEIFPAQNRADADV